jgi:hypothetical protein
MEYDTVARGGDECKRDAVIVRYRRHAIWPRRRPGGEIPRLNVHAIEKLGPAASAKLKDLNKRAAKIISRENNKLCNFLSIEMAMSCSSSHVRQEW